MKKVLFLTGVLLSMNAHSEYKMLMGSNKIDVPKVSVEEELQQGWSKYDPHVVYKLTEMDVSLFSSPSTGFTSSSSNTSEGNVFGSPHWSTRSPYKAMRPGYEKKTTELGIYEESYTSSSGNAVLGFTFNEPKIIKKALYIGWYDYSDTMNKVAYPNSFRFEASQDGVTWVAISDWYTPPSSNNEDEFVVYKFNNDVAYKSYQIRMQSGSTIRAQYQYVKSLFFYE